MSQFADQPWANRFQVMGDTAEKKFLEEVDGDAERWGFNRPDGVHLPSLPERVRSAPDFVQTRPYPRFVECKGLGRNQRLSIKLATLGSLHWWHGLMHCDVYVWDSHKKRSCFISVPMLDSLIQTPELVEVDYFDECKFVFRVPADQVFEHADG